MRGARKKPDQSKASLPGERWGVEAPIGAGRGLLIVAKRAGKKVLLPETRDDALLMAQAPRMYAALFASVSEARECGYFEQRPYHPKAGCSCGECQGLRALALAEGGGRCILCGCTWFDACAPGCGWADASQLVCTAHPPKMIAAAQRFLAFAKEVR